MEYCREKAAAYAHRWAYDRNPAYPDFSRYGGDCTNFVSQCLYAGCGVMDTTPDVGWFCKSLNHRAAAWTSAEYLYRFLTGGKGIGPYGKELPLENAQSGDIIQLSFDGKTFGHSLLVVRGHPDIHAAAHSDDADYRPLRTYSYRDARLIHIEGCKTIR
jgi:hypothetical protein